MSKTSKAAVIQATERIRALLGDEFVQQDAATVPFEDMKLAYLATESSWDVLADNILWAFEEQHPLYPPQMVHAEAIKYAQEYLVGSRALWWRIIVHAIEKRRPPIDFVN